MQLTQKETMLLQDLKSQEQLCVEKYSTYSDQACDAQLKAIFDSIKQSEQSHLDTVNQMLGGTVPMMGGGSNNNAMPQPSNCAPDAKAHDAYLCQDAIGTEKHVSSVYDTAIFEFKDKSARDMLNHIQKEEQEHGKRIYDYMEVNAMYG